MLPAPCFLLLACLTFFSWLAIFVLLVSYLPLISVACYPCCSLFVLPSPTFFALDPFLLFAHSNTSPRMADNSLMKQMAAERYSLFLSCLLSAVCCLLSDVCCLLSAVCCLLFVVCCLLSAVCCLMSAVCCQLSAVCCLLSAVCCPLSTVSLLSTVYCLLSVVCCPLSAVCCLLSDV